MNSELKIISVVKARRKNYCFVNFDNGEFLLISMDLVIEFSLSKGKKLSKDQFTQILNKENLIQAKQITYRYATSRSRTAKEIRQKLKEKDFTEEVIEKMIAFCYEFDLINETELAKNYILDNFKLKSKGKNRIRIELINKGINPNLVEDALSEYYPNDDEYEKAKEFSLKKLKTKRTKDELKIKKSLYDSLIRKGYDSNIAIKVIKEIL